MCNNASEYERIEGELITTEFLSLTVRDIHDGTEELDEVAIVDFEKAPNGRLNILVDSEQAVEP